MSSPLTRSGTIALIASLIFLRALIGLHPHSGQNNHHGSKTAYGGDFEAQRHWMEITLHVPISSWYWHDLHYWGLDYPPLTAYVSYICGYFSEKLVGPESVRLYDSRYGYEDPVHKTYMRWTVLVLEVMIYFPIVWILAERLCDDCSTKRRMWIVGLALAQPALILIDHGHFQYNTVALGLSLWSIHFITQQPPSSSPPSSSSKINQTIGPFWNPILGSIFFCLALNFKQMTLYYAPAIFAYLLGKCFGTSTTTTSSSSWKPIIVRFLLLSTTVVFTFLILWSPFLLWTPEETITPTQNIRQILKRIFPFQRGLFEGKVANVWCALNTKPISIRNRIPERYQPLSALVLTLGLLVPSCIQLFHVGRQQQQQQQSNKHHLKMMLWGTACTALAFFLGSFQVHEKSILMVLSPISMLLGGGTREVVVFVSWISLVCVWTLWPLMRVDRLDMAYLASVVIFCVLLKWFYTMTMMMERNKQTKKRQHVMVKLTEQWIIPLSILVMMSLHLLEWMVDPPMNLKDLYEVLWSVVGCGLFCWSWVFCSWVVIYGGDEFFFLLPAKKSVKKQS